MEKIEFELVADTQQSNKNIENVNKSIVDLNKNLSATEKDAKAGMEALDKGAKDAGKSSFSLGKTLKTAFAVGGIVGIAVKLFDKFKEVLGENQKVVDLFAVATEAVSLVLNDLVNLLVGNIDKVKQFMDSLFKDPLGTIKEFAISFKQGFLDRLNQALEVLGFLGSAIKKVFEGDFTGAMEDVKMAGKQTVDVFTGVDDSFDKVAESVSNYTKEVIKTAAANVDLANSAELAAARNQGLLEQFDFENEKLRQVRDEERNSVEDRIKANNDLRDNLQKQQKLIRKNKSRKKNRNCRSRRST